MDNNALGIEELERVPSNLEIDPDPGAAESRDEWQPGAGNYLLRRSHHYVCEQTSSKGREIEDARAEIINHLCKVATRERTG